MRRILVIPAAGFYKRACRGIIEYLERLIRDCHYSVGPYLHLVIIRFTCETALRSSFLYLKGTSMPNVPLMVGLLWHSSNSDNFGVGALTVSQIALIDKAAEAAEVEVSYRIFGWRDSRESYVIGPNIDAVPMRTRDLVPLVGSFGKNIRACDLVLDIGAGDSFADIYGVKRFIKTISAKLHVLAGGRPLVLSPQTLGPYDRPWARRLALYVIRRARAVFTRDQLSTKFVREIGFTGEVREASDVALRLPYEELTVALNPSERLRFGINVSGLLFNGGYTGRNQFGLATDYATLVRSILLEFTARGDCEVHLVGHVISDTIPVEDDYRVAALLGEEFPGAVVAPKFGSPSEAKSYIAGLDFFAGARMHACIAAFSSGVPVIPMAYSRKFAGLFGTLGYERTVDCRSDTAETILAALREGFENRAALAVESEAARDEGQKRLNGYVNFLTELLRESARAK